MSSSDFPSLNKTHHILTKMADPSIRSLRKRKELTDKTLYPNGFPCDQLISAGLSEKSAGFPTPKEAYANIISKWKRKQDGKARKAAMSNFDDDDGPPLLALPVAQVLAVPARQWRKRTRIPTE